MTTPALRPLGLGEILDLAIKIYRSHFLTLLKIVLVVLVPVQVLSSLITASSAPEETYTLTGEQVPSGTLDDASEIAPYAAGQLLVGLLGVVTVLLTTAACFKAVGDAYLGRQPEWGDSLRFALRRLPSLLWLTLLSVVLLLLAAIALIIPAIWLGVAWLAATPVLLFEGVKGRRALGRSFRLVRNRWWPTFGTFVVALLLIGIVTGILTALLVVPFALALSDDASPVLSLVVGGVLNLLATALTTPVQAAIVALIYFDLRVRKEGLDLELLARGMGGSPDEIGTPLAPTAIPTAPSWGQPPPGQQAVPAGGQWAPPSPPGPSPASPPADQWAPPRPPGSPSPPSE